MKARCGRLSKSAGVTAEPRKALRREGSELGRGHKEFYSVEELWLVH
jgi:hypothetical protein